MQAAKVPNELLDFIASYACCDGGTTARSLQLVSRTLKAITEPYKFQSVALSGPPRMKAFLRSFESSSEAARANLRHVFIWPSTARTGLFDLLLDVLETISPTVESLVFVTDNRPQGEIAIDVLKEVSFPRLTHLKLATPTTQSYNLDIPKDRPQLFPNLTHVHWCLTTEVHLEDVHRPLCQLFSIPSSKTVKCIRISGCAMGLSSFPSFLAVVLGYEPASSWVLPLPPSVEKYIAQVPPGADSMLTDKAYKVLMQWNEEAGRIKCKVLKGPPNKDRRLWKSMWLKEQGGERDINEDWNLGS
ncbi:hypothetical protein GLOTRDRAFT_132342 [Gloeophyllum trabeum ATCC 11539]|uniref:F-box domain-containing protein n=1 Tax=Gloeophyllum trabeum (strain ATCC 11539 / FP-39264 / Madison 617) TaxID=670483 RepID=S7PXH8_GLOTA|nr:uncharacterized protein GLOTRDRAFT_132342 [Gloeophyllum trabeum ATCC 11539]EPQ52223.1 hypothetical protein GLOTRDRAFT_132342 [Gloeophyllum trabeum ATCC 11539]